MSLTDLAASGATFYRGNFLPERCTIKRVTGTGASVAETTVATGVPYRRGYTRPTDWVLQPGLIVAREQPRARFRIDEDIQVQDTVTDEADGHVYLVRGVQPAGVYGVAQTALLEERT
jgi:hypothetical protein